MADKTSLSVGAAVRSRLMNDAAVTAITKTVFPVYKDKAVLPYVFYRRSGFAQTAQKTFGDPCDTVLLELACCAAAYGDSVKLAEAVRAALDGAQWETDGLKVRSCGLADADESWADDAYIQSLTFTIKL